MNDTPLHRKVLKYTLLGVLLYGALFILGFLVWEWREATRSVRWAKENFSFLSGAECFVFMEPKLVVFIGPDGPYDRVCSWGTTSFDCGCGEGYSQWGTVKIFEYKGERRFTTMKFLDGKCVMQVNNQGTRLRLADGRLFDLTAQTPLWLRCKDDGTIEEMKELPPDFVAYFEDPSTESGDFKRNIRSYPAAFQK